MALPEFSMRQLLEAGVHFGHQSHRWNPKMAPYIYGVRNKIHILDLSQTMPALYRALKHVREVVSGGGRVLFVGTKRQASTPIAEAARRCGQYYVNHRWLGGMLTNWKTISKSIHRLKELDEQLSAEETGLTKKEMLQQTRQRDKLERALGGIRDMGGLPDVLVVIDINREDIAIKEAAVLGIPVVAVLDSNCDPDGIAFPVPGNDDATRAINLYCQLMSDAVLDGIQAELVARGVDIGSQEAPVEEVLQQEAASKEAAAGKTRSEAKPEPKAKDKAETETKLEAKPEEKTEAKAEAKVAAKAEEKSEEKPKADAKAEPKAKTEAKTEAKDAGKKEAKKEPEPEITAEAEPKVEPAAKTEPEEKPEAKPEAKPAAKTEPEEKPEAKPEAKPAAKTEPEAKPEAKLEAKPAAKTEPKEEAKPEAKPAAPKADAAGEGEEPEAKDPESGSFKSKLAKMISGVTKSSSDD